MEYTGALEENQTNKFLTINTKKWIIGFTLKDWSKVTVLDFPFGM
jgi:hypothetical protein